MKRNRGFTLIELLVVIAIIGILSAVVLTSLGTARNSARDAAVLSALSSFRSGAELNFGSDFSTLCVSGFYYNFRNDINAQGAEIVDCDATTGEYRIVTALPSTVSAAYNDSLVPTAYALVTGGGGGGTSSGYPDGEDEGFCISSDGAASRVAMNDTLDNATFPACS